jgi:hypothetical protein
MTRAVVAFFILLLSFGAASAQSCGSYPNTLTNGTNADANQVMANFNFIQNCLSVQQIANNGTTATVLNELAIFTGAPTTATVATTSSTTGVAGIVIGGAGTSGNAQIAYGGQASCIFDGATTAGDYVQASLSSGGKCHDAGSTYPTSNQVLGRVLSTNGAGGTYAMEVFGPEINASTGGGGVVAGAPGIAVNMKITRGSTTTLTVAFDAVFTGVTLGGTSYRETGGSHTLTVSGTGANGMDTGSVSANGFVCVYSITKGDNTTYAVLGQDSATNSGCPGIFTGTGGHVLPSGYVASALIGIWPTSSSNLVVGTQLGRHFRYQGTTAPIVVTTGTAVSLTALATTTAWPPNSGNSVVEVDVFMTQTLAGQRAVPAIAADANGTGIQMMGFASGAIPVNGCSSFSPLTTCTGSASFQRTPSATSQTLFWADLSGNNANNIYVTGYWF